MRRGAGGIGETAEQAKTDSVSEIYECAANGTDTQCLSNRFRFRRPLS